MEIYITICNIDSQWEFVVWLRKLKQGLCMNLEGVEWRGRGKAGSKGSGQILYRLSHQLLLFGRPVVSDSLRSHGLQHTREALQCPQEPVNNRRVSWGQR